MAPAYPNHIYVAIGGRLGDNEEWQTGFRLMSEDFADPAAQVDRARDSLDDIEGHVNTWWAAIVDKVITAAHWDYLKVNAIGPDGRYLDQTTNAIFYTPTEAGHVGTASSVAFQLAVVMSLKTGFTRGLAHSGRMYLPCALGTVNNGSGQASTATPTQLATATAALFTGINDNPGLDVAKTRVAIVSSQGPWNNVTGVTCGLVPDTQRRRRKALDEAYIPEIAVTGQG